ncbi:MAG: serine/threonine protein kinase [Longimicrobiales bacterium]
MIKSYGKYQLIEQVGEGGFGRVFRALDPMLKREVAVKTCSIPQADIRARFVREAEIVASLKHRHIVTVYDFGTEEGEPYIVQEFLGGQDLRQVLDSVVAVDLATKVRWLRQIADGLQHAHSKGVVHRDIKPSNVRIEVDGDVRIMDFGIAKLLQAQQQLTQTGLSIGTMGYLAPEQLMGGDIDHRADIFSFGVLAYEVISGRKAFDGNSVTAILYRIAHEEPPPLSDVCPDCPRALVECVNVCLQKDRDCRWNSFLPVIGELDAVAISLSRGNGDAVGHGAKRSSRGRGWRVAPAAVVLGVALIGVTLVSILNAPRAGQPRAGDAEEPQWQRLAHDSSTASLTGKAVLPAESTVVELPDRGGAAARTPGTAERRTGGPAPENSAGREPRTTAPPPASTPLLDMRRAVVLVHADSRAIQDAIASTIVNDLRQAGFTIVDNAVVNATRDTSAPAQHALTSLGKTHGAGFVVFIDGTAEAVPFSGMYTGTVTLTARVYAVRDGSLAGTEIGEIGGGGTPGKLGASQSAATVDAARAAAIKLLPGIRKLIETV